MNSISIDLVSLNSPPYGRSRSRICARSHASLLSAAETLQPLHSISDQPSRESYERRKPNAAAHRVVHLAAASSLSHPVYCSLSRSQMLQPPHFNVAARGLAHERTCETAANPPADASPAWSCGQPRDRIAAVRARDATQRLRPAARCGLRITRLISIHSHWWILPPHARKNPIQITCRYMAALLESCT